MVDVEGGFDLPDTIELTQKDIDLYWDLWVRWRATEKRFLPSQLLNEPDRPFSVLIKLDSIYAMVEQQVLKELTKKKANDGEQQ